MILNAIVVVNVEQNVMKENSIETAREFLSNLEPNSSLEETLVLYADYLTKEEKKSLEERKMAFIESVRPYVEDMGAENANAFCKYWMFKGERDRKMRFEKQKTWDIKGRIRTWMSNVAKRKKEMLLRAGIK